MGSKSPWLVSLGTHHPYFTDKETEAHREGPGQHHKGEVSGRASIIDLSPKALVQPLGGRIPCDLATSLVHHHPFLDLRRQHPPMNNSPPTWGTCGPLWPSLFSLLEGRSMTQTSSHLPGTPSMSLIPPEMDTIPGLGGPSQLVRVPGEPQPESKGPGGAPDSE